MASIVVIAAPTSAARRGAELLAKMGSSLFG
jgi:hypothetical protein